VTVTVWAGRSPRRFSKRIVCKRRALRHKLLQAEPAGPVMSLGSAATWPVESSLRLAGR
jgi:hypothetical protein